MFRGNGGGSTWLEVLLNNDDVFDADWKPFSEANRTLGALFNSKKSFFLWHEYLGIKKAK